MFLETIIGKMRAQERPKLEEAKGEDKMDEDPPPQPEDETELRNREAATAKRKATLDILLNESNKETLSALGLTQEDLAMLGSEQAAKKGRVDKDQPRQEEEKQQG